MVLQFSIAKLVPQIFCKRGFRPPYMTIRPQPAIKPSGSASHGGEWSGEQFDNEFYRIWPEFDQKA